MTTVNLSFFAGAGAQLFDNNGVPLSGGLIYSYLAGTTTPVATYTSNTGTIQNSNPIVLDSSGRVTNEIWVVPGQTYKFVVQTASATQIGSYDNIPAINDFSNIYSALANTTNISQGASLIGFKAENNGSFINGAVGTTVEIKLSEMISVEDFGAVGDGVTNDSAAIQAAFTWSSTNQKAIYLQDKRYYVNTTINCNGAIIRSFSGNPGTANPYFWNPSGSGSYYMDWGTNATYTWAQMIAATATGCCIISDYNGPILQISNGNGWNITGIAIVGYHRQPQQIGLNYSASPAVNIGGGTLSNVSVLGCGNSGMYFSCGLQEGTFINVISDFNNGDGITVTYTSGASSPVDFNIFENSRFQFNRGNGLFFSYVTKHFYVTGCDFSGNGQYAEGYNGTNYIDPILGYDRTPPTNVALMKAGLWINDGDFYSQSGAIYDVNLTNCEGEEIAVGFHINATTNLATLQFLNIQNCSFYKTSPIPYSGGNNGSLLFLNVGNIIYSRISQCFCQALDFIDFPSGNPPPQINGNNYSNEILNSYIPSSNASASKLQNFLSYNVNVPLLNKYRTYGTQYVAGNPFLGSSGNLGGLSSPGNVTTSAIANDLSLGTGSNQAVYTANYMITANQGTSSSTVGAYLVTAFLAQGSYGLVFVAMSGVNGFTSAPSINSSTGVLTIPASAGYYFSINRLDINLTNTTP